MDDTVTVWVDGAEIAQLTVPGLPGGSGKPGVRYNQNAGASLYSLSYRTANNLQSLAEDDIVTETSIASTGDNAMKVILDKDFPRVLRYELGGETMQGQQIGYRELEINNTRVTDAKVTSNIEGNKAVYTITGTVKARAGNHGSGCTNCAETQ